MSSLEARLSHPDDLPKVKREQYKQLEQNFKRTMNPTDIDLVLISAEVGLSEADTRRWFEHRLAMWRKQQGLPANGGPLNNSY